MAHCAVIRRFVSIWRRGLPLQRPDIPHHKHQNPSEGVEDAIDREFNDLFDQWRKLTNEILSEPTERYEIGESVLLGKAIPYPAQVNSVKGVYLQTFRWGLYDEIDISDARGLTERGYWTQIMNHTRSGDVLVLGENMITDDDHAGTNWWCNEAIARDMTVIMGVMGATGVGEVWRFDHDTCPAPLPLYRAEIGIPMVNAGWWPATRKAPQHEGTAYDPEYAVAHLFRGVQPLAVD